MLPTPRAMALYDRYCRGESSETIAKSEGVSGRRIRQMLQSTSQRLAEYLVHEHQEIRVKHASLLEQLFKRSWQAFENTKNPAFIQACRQLLGDIRSMIGCNAPAKVTVSDRTPPITLAFAMQQMESTLSPEQLELLANRAEQRKIHRVIDAECITTQPVDSHDVTSNDKILS